MSSLALTQPAPTGGLGTALSIGTTIAKNLPLVGNILNIGTAIGGAIGIKGKSPRYGGGDGPLYSTVNAFIARIATGDVGVINQLNQLRKTDADAVQWQLFWSTDMLKVPMTSAQKEAVTRHDPTIATQLYASQRPAASVAMTNIPGSSPLASFNLQKTSSQYVILGAMVLGALYLAKGR